MFQTSRFRLLWPWMSRPRSIAVARVASVCLGVGLGTALAADLSTLNIPVEMPDGAISDAQVAASNWRLFDPGFIADHLPFKLTVGQTISYSDNVSNLPPSVPLLAGLNGLTRLPSRGDFYSDTIISSASRFPMGAQTFFFNATYAPRKYFKDTALDSTNYNLNGGVSLVIGSRCTAQLVGSLSQAQASLEQTAGFGVNNQMTTSFDETARCVITGHLGGLFNSGISRSENSGISSGFGSLSLPFSLNNSTQTNISGGLDYALSGLDSLRAIATFITRDFDNRPAGLGLASQTQQDNYEIFYDRAISSKLDVNASGGLTVFSTPQISSKTLTKPIYSFQVTYRPTPKLSASFTQSQAVGAPQSVVADFQQSESQSLSLSYRYSPKLSVSGALTQSTSQNPIIATNQGGTINNLNLLFSNSKSKAATVGLNYSASPMVTATAAYTYSERTDTSRSGFNAVSNVFRVGLFYTR